MEEKTMLESLNIADRTLREHPEIKPHQEKLSDDKVVGSCETLAELAIEKAHLGHLLYKETGKTLYQEEAKTKWPPKPVPERHINIERDTGVTPTNQASSLEDELLAIKDGEIDKVLASNDLSGEATRRLRKRLAEVELEISNLVAYPQVVDSYRKNFRDKIELLRRAREVERLKQYGDRIDEQDETLLARRQNDGQLSGPDEDLLAADKARKQAIASRVLMLEADPQVETEERRRELISYRDQLKRDRYVETPSVKDLLKTLTSRVHLGKPILLWGHTGTGKTETVLHLARKLTGQEPEIFSGSEEVTHYDLFGKSQLGPEGSYFQAGPATKALEEGRPLLIDEVDLVPHAIIGRIQHLLTRKPGDVITIQENSNESIKVPPGFIVLATGNIRSHKYRREEMDPAFLRRFWQTEVPYAPASETYDILVASLIDRRGALALGSPTDVTDLENLVKGAKFTQEVFAGERTDFMGEGAQASRGLGASLEKATLSIGDLLAIVRSWKAGNFQSPLGDHLLSEFVRSQTVRQDQLNLVKIFTLHNFFKGKSAPEFGIAGLTEEKLAAYRTGKR